MIDNYNLPKSIELLLQDLPFEIDSTGRSGDTTINFDNTYILKISKDKNKLKREKDKNDYLLSYIPVNKTIIFEEDENYSYYLKSYIDGKPLCDDEFLSNPDLLISLIKKALEMLSHVDTENCPFKAEDSNGNNFVHGDFCLPNILVKDEKIVGFIDLENAGKGDVWYDYAWIIWSFEYNLKTNIYTPKLLDKLGIEFDNDKYKMYIPEDY